jgi:hypothetical protein
VRPCVSSFDPSTSLLWYNAGSPSKAKQKNPSLASSEITIIRHSFGWRQLIHKMISSGIYGVIPAGLIIIVILRFIWRKVKSPSRTSLIVFLDTLCDFPAFLGIGPWSTPPDEIPGNLEIAAFGDRSKEVVLKYREARHEGMKHSHTRFSPAGQAILRNTFHKRLDEKKALFAYLERHPTVTQIKVKPPVFVIGFTRTGTTFLHEMLGLHESVRSHYTWEQMNLVPATESEQITDLTAARKQRYQDRANYFNFLKTHVLGEKIQYIHRIDYDEPEECTIPCSLGLPWSFFYLPLMIYAAKEVLPLGAGNAFNLYKQFLQLQTFQAADRRDQDFTWMLKCPFHLPYLHELANTFPGCTIVWTHRNPVECFASACSLFNTILLMVMEEESVNAKEMGQAIMNYSRYCLDAAEKSLEELKGKVNIVHVRYQDNVKNPKQEVKKVLEKVRNVCVFLPGCSNPLLFYLAFFYFSNDPPLVWFGIQRRI